MPSKAIDKWIDYSIRAGLLGTAAFSLIDYLIRKAGLPAFVAAGWDEGLLLVLLAAWGLQACRERKLDVAASAVHRPLGAVALIALLSVLVNRVPLPIAIEALRVLLQATLFFFLAANLVTSRKQLELLVTVMLVSVTIVAAYGVYQYAIGLETPGRWVTGGYEDAIKTRVFSTIGNPNALGGYLILFLPLAITLAIDARIRLVRLAYAGSGVLMLLCLVFTFSRGAWLGFLASVVILGLLLDRRILWVMGIGLALSPVILPKTVINRMLFAFSPEYLRLSYTWGRLRFWLTALERIKAHPFLGVGLGTFGDTVAMRHKLPGAIWVDNQYLKLGAEMGLLGLGAFLWLLAGTLGIGSRGSRQTTDGYTRALLIGATAGLAAVAVQNFTASIWEVLIVGTYWWFVAGLLVAALGLSRAAAVGEQQEGH